MKEIKASIWDRQWDGYWRVIPINTVVKADGCLVMGGGKNSIVQQAAERYPELAKILGRYYTLNSGIFDYKQAHLLAFPTKIDWKKSSSVELIESGLSALRFANFTAHTKIVCPRLGCGLGKLEWEKDVKPLVEKYFGGDDNFVAVYQ